MMMNNGIFSVRKRSNFYGDVLTDKEAFELGGLITSVNYSGNTTGIVTVYFTKGSGNSVKNILKKFGSKYPYGSITVFVGYLYYDCKKKGDSKAVNQANGLVRDLNEILTYYRNLKTEADKQDLETNYDNGNWFIPKSTITDPDSGKYPGDHTDGNTNIFIYIGVAIVAFILFYFIFRK